MKHLIVIVLVFMNTVLCAQSYQLNGTVIDNENTPLIGATVVVLDKDTTMIAFGITDDSGKYEVYDVPAGNQILQVSYTGYSDHSQAVLVEGDEDEIDLGLTTLGVSSQVLEEVSIKAEHIPMGILGDTINYNAAAFKTRPGASVEDLLKTLPGIEVARDGSIKAQGEDVQNVLVDGKEFFSGDVTMATKNLEAEAIDKVQVYDKKSEEAEFTGVDDGQEEKTINLKLKDGYKNGGFGKVELNGGTEDTRLGKLNYNRFSPSVQASIIANSNNINEQLFSFNDYIEFLGGFQNAMSIGGFSDYQNDAGGGSGIKDQSSVGTNLNLDVSKTIKINANYLFAGSNHNIDEIGRSENFTDAVNFTTLDTSLQINKGVNHRLNTKLKFNPNPMNSFTLNSKFFVSNTDNRTNSRTSYLVDNVSRNMLANNLLNDNHVFSINSDLLYKRKYAKKGRNVIARTKLESVSQDEESDIDNMLNTSMIDERVLQFQSFENRRKTWTGNLTYNEPIGKKLYLALKYSFMDEQESPVRRYFERESEQLNELIDLSGVFQKEWSSHTGAFSLKRNRKKLKLNGGLGYTTAKLIARDSGDQLNENSNFGYFLPSFGIDKSLKGSGSLTFNYGTKVNSPSLSQMVNQINNQNPNFTILGNPNLRPEYTHTARVSYNTFDSFNFSSMFWNFTAEHSPNKIVNSREYLEGLVTEILPVNSTNYRLLSTYFQRSAPIRKLRIKYSVSARVTYNKYKTFINKISNDISSANGEFGIKIENRNKDVFDIVGGAKLFLDAYSNDFNSNFDAPFLNQSLYVDGFVALGKSWTIGSKYDYLTFNSAFFDDGQVLHLLNGSLSKSFLDNNLEVKITAHDILNQNRGISRSGGANSLNDSRFNTLGRYIMLGVSYRLGIVKKSGIQVDID